MACLETKKVIPLKTKQLLELKDEFGLTADPGFCHPGTRINHIVFSAKAGLVELFQHKFGFTPQPIDDAADKIQLCNGELEFRVDKNGPTSLLQITAVALDVPDIKDALKKAMETGAKISTLNGVPTIEICRNLSHPLVSGSIGLHQRKIGANPQSGYSFEVIDHIAICIPADVYESVLEAYIYIFGLHVCHEEYVDTKVSAMDSQVLTNKERSITLVFMKPCAGKEKSQIQRFIDLNGGGGVQHIALKVNNIMHAVQDFKARDVEFLQVNGAYYDDLPTRIHQLPANVEALRELGILVDQDDHGLLLQIFTRPLLNDQTVFFELIERHGCLGFGSGNIKALFKSVEQDIKNIQ